MFKKITLLLVMLFMANFSNAQNKIQEVSNVYINVFIDADKKIYIETDRTNLEDVEQKVSEILRNKPFAVDRTITYRIFADQTLKMASVIDLSQELLKARNEKVRQERYLLNSMEMNIDGKNWFESINISELKRIQ